MRGRKRKLLTLLPLFGVIALIIVAWGEEEAKSFTGSEGITAVIESPEIAVEMNKRGAIPKVSGGIEMDGNLNESVWSATYGQRLFTTAFYNEPADPDTAVKLGYDENYLFIGLEGHSDGGEPPETERAFVVLHTNAQDGHFYSIPLVIQEGPNPISIRYNNQQDAKDSQQTIVNLMDSQAVNPVIVRQTDGSWTAEMAVPYSALGVSAVAAGEEWGLNVIRYFGINSPRRLSSLAPIRASQFLDGESAAANRSYVLQVYVSNEGRLNNIFFDHLADDAQSSKPAVEWTPLQPPRMFYESFTDKEVTFDEDDLSENDRVHMTWVTPSGLKTEISSGSPQLEDGRWRIPLTHPQPLEEGQYRLILAVEQPAHPQVKTVQLSFDRYSLIAAGDQRYSPTPGSGTVTQVTYAPPSDTVSSLLSLIPEKVGFMYAKLPHDPTVSERNTNYTWDPANPDVITSTDSQHLQFPNPLYPENKSLTVVNRLGEQVEYPYYEDAEGHRYFLSAHRWYLQRSYVRSRIVELADTDPLGAARLLYRFAEVYAGWVPVTDQTNEAQYPIEPASGPPYNNYGGMWYRWSISELSGLTPLMEAYTKLKQTDAMELLSTEVGEDVNQRIVEGMFKPSIVFVQTFPDNKFNQNVANYIGLIDMAIALDDPKYMHEAVEKLDIYTKSMYMLDGFWKEVSIGYHSGTITLLKRAMDKAAGWSDPVGYESPRTGERFENLDLAERIATLDKMIQMRGTLAYPDRSTLPINDTWANQKVPVAEYQITGSLLKPAAGITKLVKGTGTAQSQLYMTFAPNYGHHHHSPLNLLLYAKGQELLPDIGYTHTKYRSWTKSTLSHNTVVVDGKSAAVVSEEAITGGNLARFIQMGDEVEVVRAEQKGAYPELSEYGREPWFIGFNGGADEEGYVLDLFRVAGGDRHEYTLNGDANRTAYFETDLPMTEYGPYLLEGNPVVTEPNNEYETGSVSDGQYYAYMYVRDVRSASLPDGKYEVTLKTLDGMTGKAGLKVTGFAGEGDNELFIGKSPSLKATRTLGESYDTQEEAGKYFMPKLVLRKEGTDLKSNFITVMEPLAYLDQPKIEIVDVLKSDSATGEIAVSITYGNTQDIVLSSPHYTNQPLVVGDLRLDGRMGFIRLVDGEITQMKLADGTRLQKGDQIIASDGLTAGTITGTLRKANGDAYDAIVTEAVVPVEAEGRYITVTHPDQTTAVFKILQVLYEEGHSILVLDDQDPGFDLMLDGSSELKYYPMTSWTGEHTFHIANVDESAFEPSGETAVGTVTGAVYDNGIPLAGVSIHLTGYGEITASTDLNGQFTLPQVPVGMQRVTGVKPGYATTVSQAVYVSAQQTAAISFVMENRIPPLLTHTAGVGVRIGESVVAASSKDGYVYLVPETTPPFLPALEEAVADSAQHGISANVMAGVSVTLDTYGLAAGNYTLYAVDEGGRISTGSAILIMPFDLTVIDNASSLAKYSGEWRNYEASAFYSGSMVLGRESGASVEIPFYGKAAKLIGSRNNVYGKAKVYVDGEYKTTIDYYNASALHQQELYDTGVLAEGVHVIRIEATWTKNAAAGNYYISFDVLKVLGDDEIAL
ncbi:MAG: Heparinase II/III-like protein [Paenibacillus sp.]|nr:Heparinase II/III-like protein [Paenibacillus sp.]